MSRNPILNDRAFAQPSPAEEWANAQRQAGAQNAGWQYGQAQQAPQAPTGWGQPEPQQTAPTPPPSHAPAPPTMAPSTGQTMSLGGVSSAALVIFAFLLVGATWGWNQVIKGTPFMDAEGNMVTPAEFRSTGVFIGLLLAAFAVAMLTVVKPKMARFTAVPYGLLEGAVLGMISSLFDAAYPGIVIQALLATFGVFLVMLALYGLRILRATPKFTKGVIAATLGIAVMYGVGFLLNLVMSDFTPFWHSSGPLGIAVSVVVVIVASLNLILDFDFIEEGSKRQLPAYMDWYAAFGLILTLVWLYLEMLRLIAKLRE